MTVTTDTAQYAATASAEDRHEAEHIRTHHGHLVAELGRLAHALQSGPEDAQARTALTAFLDEKLLPHAAAEETSIYAAAAKLEPGRLLIDALVREHRLIQGLIAQFKDADAAGAAGWGLALNEAFRSHQAVEDEVVVPLLLATPSVSLVEAHRGR